MKAGYGGKCFVTLWSGLCLSVRLCQGCNLHKCTPAIPRSTHHRLDETGRLDLGLSLPPCQLGSGKIFFFEDRPLLREKENSGYISKWSIAPSPSGNKRDFLFCTFTLRTCEAPGDKPHESVAPLWVAPLRCFFQASAHSSPSFLVITFIFLPISCQLVALVVVSNPSRLQFSVFPVQVLGQNFLL